MGTCIACGQGLGVGRFCLNCGTPVDSSGQGHQATPIPGNPRFPLYADEVTPADPPQAPGPEGPSPRRLTAYVPYLVAGLTLLLVLGVGALLLLRGDSDQRPAANDRAPAEPAQPDDAPDTDLAAPTPPESADPVRPEPSPEATPDPADLIRFAEPSVPATAPPKRDTAGNVVRYDARNMIDGVPETTWRTTGDATGQEISLTFPEPAVLTRVGLINGYAKTDGDFDWYQGNRRITSVTWTFDDGTDVTQKLAQDRSLQSIDIDPVTTTAVRIRLDTVTAPGSGKSARDNTAISDVLLFGIPG